MRDGQGRWLPSQWQKLMALTLTALDSVTAADSPSPGWTFGGGTALALDLNHRVSYDIDVFLDSAKMIQSLVPVRNITTRAICWNDETERAEYQFPGHYLKLIVKAAGEIDFLCASALLDEATTRLEFNDRTILRERPAEIIAKKIYYRGGTCKARDIFDLAGTRLLMPEELVKASTSLFLTPEVYSRVRFRIVTRRDVFEEEIFEEVYPTEFGASYIDHACTLALEALDLMERAQATNPT